MARKVTDAMLMAYVDGELEPPASRDISDAIAADPQLKARAETFAATRRLARAAFKPELASPAPARLVEAIAGTAEPKREHRVLRRLFASREAAVALPMAASIAVACLAGGYWYGRNASPAESVLGASSLARILAETPSGQRAPTTIGGDEATLSTLATYRVTDGICRVFEVSGGMASTGIRGVGCARGGARWTVELAGPAGGSSTYAPASDGLTGSIDAYLDALEAVPADGEEEAPAR